MSLTRQPGNFKKTAITILRFLFADSRVKSLLIHTPSKFTEWLMQRGLLRLEHKCSLHQSEDGLPIQYKLGMYSDGNKQPFSGGYVWISECCPDKQISVFQGSIFESSVYPPGTLFKLFYHWSCQTSATNVLLWVKVRIESLSLSPTEEI